MSHLSQMFGQAQRVLKSNAPALLTGMGVSGVATTAYLSVKAGMAHSRRLSEGPPRETLTRREVFEKVWDLYLPPVAFGVLTAGCIIGATRVSTKRAAAAVSVLTISEKAFEEYRAKVVERIGENKELAIRDELAQQRIAETPPSSIVISGSGDVLCCELYTRRYFHSSMEALQKATNEINAKAIRGEYATLSDFYYILGLQYTTHAGDLGWTADRLLELDISTVLTEDDRPCLAFEYNYIKPL